MLKKNIVIFCGGTGASELVKMLSRDNNVNLTILVNCYDDGLSTGKLRNYIPGMLGPSDIRKNVKHSLQENSIFFSGFSHILMFRFPDKTGEVEAKNYLANITKDNCLTKCLTDHQIDFLQEEIDRFLKYSETTLVDFDFSDVSLGNILFAGLYLKDHNFNKTVHLFSKFFLIPTTVLNLTDGSDLKLLGITENNSILQNEAAICHLSHSEKIRDIFLLERYLECDEIYFIQRHQEKNIEYLTSMSHIPAINPQVYDLIIRADIIIYWAGTPYSSLFPSYLTENLLEIVSESGAKKILVTNILKDHDIFNETTTSLIEKFFRFMSRKKSVSFKYKSIVTDILVNQVNPASITEDRFFLLENTDLSYSGVSIHYKDWSNPTGKHCISKILEFLQ